VLWDKENEKEVVLLTNHFDFGATTIAAVYKDRWQIELFFNALAFLDNLFQNLVYPGPIDDFGKENLF
jgi:IS4 transposase